MTSPYAPLGFAANRTDRALAGHVSTLTAGRAGAADGTCAASRGWGLSSRQMCTTPGRSDAQAAKTEPGACYGLIPPMDTRAAAG